MTKLLMFRGREMAKIYVPHCPMFEEPKTEQYKAMLADGWHYSGHIDGETPETPQEG